MPKQPRHTGPEHIARGFTMLEMMIVVAVVAILALIAAPSYLDRFIKEQIVDALPLTDIATKPIAAAWLATQTLPADNAAANLPAEDKIVNQFIRSLAVRDGAVHITFGNRANSFLKDKVLTLRPAVVEDAPIVPVTWVCGFAEAPGNMTLKGDNKTTIPPNYLPYKCRSR